ncbi:MAG: hypothetical protein SVX43_09910, partial [Cyanobacteriota bacterium]|nr:hypothetical protein [Cyanobacteriota bacterium]
MTYSTQDPSSAEPTQLLSSVASVAPPESKTPLVFGLIELFLISVCVIAGAIAALFVERKEIVVYAVVAIIILTLLLL